MSNPAGATQRFAPVPWLTALALMGVLGIVMLWFPLSRMSTHADVGYNEGWNAYRSQLVAEGGSLYAKPPRFTITNYPPLSFHMIGFVGKLTGDFNVAGRWVSITSLAVLALLVGLVTRNFTGRGLVGAYAALFFVVGMTIFMPERIGNNDPQILGLAFSAAGLYFYTRNAQSNRLLAISAGAFAISLFTKHNVLAFPFAVGAHLLLERAWKRFAVWAGTLAVLCGGLTLFTLWHDGPYFFQHLLAPRAYNIPHGVQADIVDYLLVFQISLAAVVFWSAVNAFSAKRMVLILAFVFANLIGFAFSVGDGVERNVLFDAVIVTTIIVAIGLYDLEPFLTRLRLPNLLMLIALTVPFLGVVAFLPGYFHDSLHTWKTRRHHDAEFQQAVQFLRNRPGPALCENLLLCYEAGKPHIYDAFFVSDQIKIGRIQEAEIAGMIQDGFFPTIQIEIAPGETLGPGARVRFSERLMRDILQYYRPALSGDEFVILVRKEQPDR